MTRPLRIVLACAVWITGCASERVVLLPSPDGHASKLEVVHGANRTELAVPYSAVRVNGDRGRLATLDEADASRQFGKLLASMPELPRAYIVYFENDSSDAVLPESRASFENALADIGKREQPEVTIIGHTDRLGELEYNDRLSRERADAVAVRLRERLRTMNLAQVVVDIAGRGEREPLVATPDETSEPRNRRVEIDVR